MKITPKAKLLVSAWDAIDSGKPLTDRQRYAAQEWAFQESIDGTSERQQEINRRVLRVAVRLSQGPG